SSINQSPIYKGYGRYKLESHHTHYIFFDDGTCNSLDTGEFASNLAREISCGARRRIPLITVLVGGTLHAVSSIFTDLQKRIPIVIVESNDPDEAFSDHEDDVDITMIDEEFLQNDAENSSAPKKTTDNLSWANKSHIIIDDQVHLALRWSIADTTTENHSLATGRIWNDTTKIAQNRLLLIDALSKNLIVFVSNFVKLDIDITVLLGPASYSSTAANNSWSRKHQYLKDLYSETRRKNRDPLYLLDNISRKLDFKEEKHLGTVFKKLVGDVMNPLYEDQSILGSKPLKPEGNTNSEQMDAEYIYRDLFLWCVLTYRLEMAKIFLGQMKTRICSALIASKILKSLAAYAPDQVAKEILFSKATDFETYAIEFVRCSYFYDKYQTCELIMRRVDLYGGITCLQMAITADDKKFIHEDACQALLTNIWYDKVDPVREQTRLLINMLTFGISQLLISIYEKRFSKSSVKTKANDVG
ncbi:unnamed protein product, partial [Rotaria sp. Silwood2]